MSLLKISIKVVEETNPYIIKQNTLLQSVNTEVVEKAMHNIYTYKQERHGIRINQNFIDEYVSWASLLKKLLHT
jgi:hypothetical protein